MLARIRKAREEAEGGFTLIELLVVIIIIGILAAIAIPVFLNQRQKGYEASMKSDLRTVANELESQFTDTQAYATVTKDVTDPAKPVISVGSTVVKTTAPNVIESAATQPANGFCINATSTKTTKTWHYDSTQGGLLANACP